VSLDYGETIRWRGTGELSDEDRRTFQQVTVARSGLPGKPIRAYNVPLGSAIYRLLLDSGVDMIGTTNLIESAEVLTGFP
jgi:hypothetical protein